MGFDMGIQLEEITMVWVFVLGMVAGYAAARMVDAWSERDGS